MTPMEVQPSLCKNADCSEESIIAAADWMEEQKKATGMSATEIAAAEDAKSAKSPTTSPIKKKRKKSAYQCFCSATIATMREREPERLTHLEENKSLWKHLGAEWQRVKLDKLLFEKYTEQANHINNQESVGVGQGEQVGMEESKEAEVEIEGEVVENDGETPEDHVEVEKVLAHWQMKRRPGRGRWRYLLKFVGAEEPEWVDEEHCACDELIKEYWKWDARGEGLRELEARKAKVVESDGETPEDHVEVEKVLAHWEHVGRGIRYLIKFVGTKDPEWVDAEHCACDELVAEYWERRNARPVGELYTY